jgi:mRNA-degrading endonuclease RelE of RelBE toxin-antitoxin system
VKFKIEKLKEAEKEYNSLSKEQQRLLEDDYNIIRTKGIEFVKTRYLAPKLFEIKTKDLRSLFKYEADQIIIIGLIYEKDSQKAPNYYIKLAQKRLKP